MSLIQIWIFVILATSILIKGFVEPRRFFEFPYFMAATFVVFIFPQIISLNRFPGAAPLESLDLVMTMTNLCLASSYFGYLLPSSKWIVRHGSTPVRIERLFHIGVVFVVVSLFFSYLINRMTAEETGGSMWTGRVTIYHFFSQLVYPGFSICLYTALTKRSSIAWVFTFLAALAPIVAIIFSGRRESAALFVLTIGLTLFFQRRIVPPRALVAAGLAFAMLAIPATAKYRSAVSLEGVGSARKVDLFGNFNRFLNEESILELRNAAVLIYVTAQRGNYDFGAAYWDQMVFRFVPAQIVGKELKDKLMFAEPELEEETDQDFEIGIRSFSVAKGSTLTGMGDSFKQFGYFGCLFFALLALIFRSLWETSLQPNAFFAKLLYIQTSTTAMRAVTHQTVDYFPGLFYNVVFLGIAVLYSRTPKKTPSKTTLSPRPPSPSVKPSTVMPEVHVPAPEPARRSPVPPKKKDLSELE